MEEKNNDLMLSIEHISKSFPGVKALDDVSFRIRKGEVHALVGENGAGKSTLMKILSGVYKKDSGKVIFDGKEMGNQTPQEVLESGLSIIYQEFSLINTLSVGENIFLGRMKEAGGISGMHKKAKELLTSIGSQIPTRKMVGELSASEKQLVEIAKALSFNAKVIIMDEPSSSLGSDELEKLFSLIGELKKSGVTIIYISHKLEEIFQLCDHVTVMRDGKVISSKPISEVSRSSMIADMVGRTIENEYPERPNCVGEPLLEVKCIRTHKLHDISFTLHRGEILGLVGLVGAGRTEIVRAIFGADHAMVCDMYLEGKKLDIKNPIDARNAGFGFVPEDRKQQGLILPFSVSDNINLAGYYRQTHFGFLNRDSERETAKKYIDSLSIKTPSASTPVVTLSGGNQQKCILGRWLALSPKILILDEPTRGIDVGAKYEIYVLMKQIVEEGGSIIMISSELPEVMNMANRVIAVNEGRITGEYNPEVSEAAEIMDSSF